MARFSKVFQLMTVVLVMAIVHVYVMGTPKVSHEPASGDPATTTETKTDAKIAEVAPATTVAPASMAAEKLTLAPGSKVDFNRLFSKTEIKSRASASHNFLNAKTSAKDLFKAPARTAAAPDDQGGDSGGGGSRGTWIAVGVIAAVVTIAVIGLRHDRSSNAGSSAHVVP